MKAIRAAIIDDGISIDESLDLKKLKVIRLAVKDQMVCTELINENLFRTSHGTICYWIYSNYINNINCELYSIKVIDTIARDSNVDNLRVALNWCLENNIKLISMSLGTTNLIDFKIENVVKKLYEKNVIMIAACSNKNIYTYPASSQYVLGVRHDYKNFLPYGRFFYNDQDISNIEITCNCDFAHLGTKVNYKFGKFNSFIVPYIAAIVYNLLQEGDKTISDIKCMLKDIAVVNKDLVSYEYLKGAYINWTEKIEIPIIAIVNNTESSTKHFGDYIVDSFRSNGYNAILLQDGIDGKEFYKYSLNKLIEICGNISNTVKLVTNSINADILFINISHEYLDELADNYLIDIIVKFKGLLLLSEVEAIDISEFSEASALNVIEQIFSKLQ